MDHVLYNLQVKALIAETSELGPAWDCSQANFPCDKLYYVKEGRCFVYHDGKEFQLRPGDVHLIPAHTEHSYRCPRKVVIQWSHFNAKLLGTMNLFEFIKCPFDVKLTAKSELPILFDKLEQAYGSESAARPLKTGGLLLQLIACFLEEAKLSEPLLQYDGIARFTDVLEFIESHLHEPLKVSQLAQKAHLEKAYFSRLFTDNFGIPPMRYVIVKRIQMAQSLLVQTNQNLTTIAEKMGFTDAFHLSKTFKKIVGISPAAFRKQIRRMGP